MKLKDKIEQREAIVAIIGLGYVGLPLALSFCEAGFPVIGIDVEESKVERLKQGNSYIQSISSKQLTDYIDGEDRPTSMPVRPGKLRATTDYDVLGYADAIIIAVPTPLSKTKEPDMSYIAAAAKEIRFHLRENMLIILESTTYPGTTEEFILPMLQSGESNELKVGRDFFLAFSPERIDPGAPDWNVKELPKVIGGITPQCLTMAQSLYECAIDTIVPVSSAKTAEMTKLLENTFRAVNIGLINELAMICDKLGVDIWEAVDAASTKPFGFMPFYPGPGLGGHCIPIDPQYLAWKMKELEFNTRFIHLASEINYGMPKYVFNKILYALNDMGKPIKDSKVFIIGVAYKADVADLRESPALDLINLLQDNQAHVEYHDPYISKINIEGINLDSTSINKQVLEEADCTVIMANHQCLDWESIVQNCPLIIDTRNATKGLNGQGLIVKL